MAVKAASLVNWSKCKKFIIETAGNRAHKFTRVDKSIKDDLESLMRTEIEKIVRYQPSKGKTVTSLHKGEPETSKFDMT